MIKMPTTAILIPCYNEELTVNQVVADFKKNMPESIIYVYDNNSTDKTFELADKNPDCIARKCKIQGKGAVVKQMLSEINADYYIMADGDATYPANKIHIMQHMLERNKYDMIVGDRLSHNYHNQRAFHNFGNRLVDFLINIKFGRRQKIKDTMSGLRAFNNKLAKDYANNIKHSGFEIETEFTIFSLNNNYRIGRINCDYKDRPAGSVSKLNTIRDGFKILKLIITTPYKKS